MTDNDRFDRELSERLRAHEQRVPGGVAPHLTDTTARRGWAPLAMVGAAGLVVGAVLVGTLLQRPEPPVGEGTPSPSASSSLGDLVAVPTLPPETGETPQPCMAALLAGTLVRDETDGVAVETADRQRERVVWPYGYAARESAGGLQLLDANGQVVATEGDRLHIGGGEIADGQWAACPSDIAVVDETPVPSVAPEVTITAMDGMSPGDTVVEIGALGDEQIAVGQAADGLGLWVRRPGDSWSQVIDQEPQPADVTGFYQFNDLAVGKNGAVAVGTWILADSEFGTPRIAFTQGDMHWTTAFGPSNPASGECGLINAVTETDGGWLAVGARCPESVTGSFRGVAWFSPNGTQWSELPLAGLSTALGVAVGADRIVAVGTGDGGASASVSLDGGDTWQAPGVSPEVMAFTSVVYHYGLFVAIGSDSGIWVSDDGFDWGPALVGDESHSIGSFIELGDLQIAVGGQFPSSAWTEDQGGRPPADTVELWVSTDGQNWSGPRVAYTAKSKMLVTGASVDANGNLVIIASAILGADHTRVVPVLIEGPILGQ
jgi:hypothetical protein